ncbi:LCP family protein [Sharpea azabuensis]|uniref:LCP family protein n=1 Tax=Sharpea azabuensis TaxID=322505 RepID=UPI00156BF945|nr:LCP family protein [Sharpea azabuensis]
MRKLGKMITSWQFILSLQALVSILLMILAMKTGFLLVKFEILLAIILVILLFLMYLFVRPGKIVHYRTQIRPLIGKIVSLILSIMLAFASFFIYKGDATLRKLGYNNTQTYTFSLIVKKDSQYNKVNDLNNKKIGLNPNVDESENFNKAIDKLKSLITYDDELYTNDESLVNDLYDHKIDGMLFNEAHRPIIKESKPNFDKETKVIWQIKVTTEIEDTNKDINVTQDSFNMYISGIDTAGNIDNVSRSDVNMIVTVNPVTKNILLTSIPRDYYVTLADANAQDKLTHSGLTGVDNTMKTVENLLNVKMHFYARVNFSSLVKVVDALGGIDVKSDRDLKAWTGKDIKEGWNHMDGETALAYARCRHAYQDGDSHRVRNQQDVLMAIITKMISPALLTNYTNVLKAVEESYQSNFKSEQIADLVKMQMENSKAWRFTSYVMTGTGKVMKGGYYMPQTSLYYLIPDNTSVQEASHKINQIMEGME